MSEAIDLADRAWDLRRIGIENKLNPKEAYELATECLAMLDFAEQYAQGESAHYERAYVFNKQAHIRQYVDGTAVAIELWKKSADAARQAESGLLEGEALRHWADALRHENQLEEAGELYVRALDCLQADPKTSPLSLGNAYRPMAILHENLGDNATAKQHWLTARDLYVEAGIQAGVDECDVHLKSLDAA